MGSLRIGVLGGGQMGSALIKGMLAAGVTTPRDVVVSDISEESRRRLASEARVQVTDDNVEAARHAQVAVIALKPQTIPQVLPEIAGAIEPGKTVLSIAAGVTTGALEAALGSDAHVVRAMPNTPALIGEGIAAICGGANANADDLARAESILSSVGRVVRIDEKQMDAVTGLSGSGPGYVYTFIEALADGGVKMGLAKPLALTLASQTVLGAARMVLETGEHPAVLRDRVTSPGGTTIAGLHAMESRGIRDALISAVEAAARRSGELGG